MDFLKKNYEKVLLGVVLLGLVVGAVFLILMIPAERAALESKSAEIINRPAKPLADLDLGKTKSFIERVAFGNCLDLATTNKVFNSMQWQRKSDGTLLKIALGNEVGPEAVVVTRIAPLYTTITYHSALISGADVRYDIAVEKEAAAKSNLRLPKHTYASLNSKTDTFVIREVKGPADNPTELVIELTDTAELVSIAKDKPFKRVDGYLADFKYPPDNKTWSNQRVGSGGLGTTAINIAGESYIVVAINKNEVVLSAKSNNKKTPRPYVPAP